MLDVPCTEEEYEIHYPYTDDEGDNDPYEDKVPKKSLEGNSESIKTEKLQLRISRANRIYLFRDVIVLDRNEIESKRFNVYKSNLTV